MRLVDCHGSGQPPIGAIYIGRAINGMPRSPLANPYIAKSIAPKPCNSAVVVPDESVIERYRRHLTRDVIQGFQPRDALRELRRDSVLACWCADREAALDGPNRAQPETPCHGDVIYTVWLALQRAEWVLDFEHPRTAKRLRLEVVDFREDFDGANKAWAVLYQRAFGHPMRWGGTREDQP